MELPQRKKSEEELNELRMRNAMQMRPHIQPFQHQLANPIVLLGGYLLSFTGLGILVGLFLYLRKPLSRHHAAFMILISCLSLIGVWLFYQSKGYVPLAGR